MKLTANLNKIDKITAFLPFCFYKTHILFVQIYLFSLFLSFCIEK